MAEEKLDLDLDEVCSTCAASEDGDLQDVCEEAKRDCMHHCNHVWTTDACCWCGWELGEVD